jgi:hypothetical protein
MSAVCLSVWPCDKAHTQTEGGREGDTRPLADKQTNTRQTDKQAARDRKMGREGARQTYDSGQTGTHPERQRRTRGGRKTDRQRDRDLQTDREIETDRQTGTSRWATSHPS